MQASRQTKAATLSELDPARELERLSALRSSLFSVLQHGDPDHRRWLQEAIDAHFSGEPVPAPYGKGTAEAKLDAAEAERDDLRAALISLAHPGAGRSSSQAADPDALAENRCWVSDLFELSGNRAPCGHAGCKRARAALAKGDARKSARPE